MKICIIHINQSPPPLPTIEEPPYRFMRHLTPYLDFDVDWDVVRLLDGALPKVHDYDGYLITGGSAPLVPDISELPETTVNLLEFIRTVYDAKVPMVGICWGHQAVCKALGGVVSKLEKYGMGIRETHVIKKYDWMQKAPDSVRLYSMHTCQVTSHPKEGELFLSSDFCPNAGYVFGTHALTMQQHPDYNMIVSEAMINSREDRLPPEQFKIAKDSLSTPHHTELSCQWVGNFFKQASKNQY